MAPREYLQTYFSPIYARFRALTGGSAAPIDAAVKKPQPWYVPPYANGTPVSQLQTSHLYKSMAEYKGSNRIFLQTIYGNGLLINGKLDTRLVDDESKKLRQGVLDARGMPSVDMIIALRKQLDGRSSDSIDFPEDHQAAQHAIVFHKLVSLGFRYEVDPGGYVLFPNLIKSVTSEQVAQLAGGLEILVNSSRKGGVQVTIKDTSLVKLIEDSANQVHVDNRRRVKEVRYGKSTEKASGPITVFASPGKYIFITPCDHVGLLLYNLNVNGHAGAEKADENLRATGGLQIGNFYSRLLVVPAAV